MVNAKGWELEVRDGPHFSDVPPAHPEYKYIETAVSRGILAAGTLHLFLPDQEATRGEICKVLYDAQIGL